MVPKTAPPDVRKCEKPGHPHYDVRWGCPFCPNAKDQEIAALTAKVDFWKEGWFDQRRATGKVAWDFPIPSYLSRVDCDPRLVIYFHGVWVLLEKLFALLEAARSTSSPESSPTHLDP